MSNVDENVVNKIKTLLNKNTKNGATEEECMSSIKMAKKLMQKYGVTEDDFKTNRVKYSDFGTQFTSGAKIVTAFEKCVSGYIAEYTNTKVFMYTIVKNHNVIAFFGHKVDVSLAIYILDMCKLAFKNGWDMYKTNFKTGQVAKHRVSYSIGMADRIAERLQLYTKEEVSETGTDLIVLKNAIVEQLADRLFQKPKQNLVVTFDKYDDSYGKGFKDGDNAELNRKTTKQEKTLAITKES